MSSPSTYDATDGEGCERRMGWRRRLAEPLPDFVGTGDPQNPLR